MAESNPQFKKTILVGLGGAGNLILTHLKKQFLDMYEAVPPSIKFLSLDTDLSAASLRSARSDRQIKLEDREFLYMKVDNPIQFIENSGVQEWFIKPLPAGSISRGAGAVREVGRVAFFHHLPDFLKRVDRLMTELNFQGLPDLMGDAKNSLGANTNFNLAGADAEIYICGSLAGGTGSGTFIDVGVLLRDQFRNALIHGFFLLNWIYRNKAFAYRVPGNVYAALCELDNLQSIVYGDQHFTPYSVKYADRRISVGKSPFDLVHLIDGRNEQGENVLEVGDLCETTATAIFLSVSAMGDAVASVVDNLLAHVNASPRELWQKRYPKYSSFGLSSLYYPAEELHRFLAHREAEKLCKLALAEIRSAAGDLQELDREEQRIADDVDQFFGDSQLNLLNRAFVRDKACPFQTPIGFPIQPFQIADKGFPGMIDFQFEQEEKNIRGQLKEKWQEDGRAFIEETAAALELKIASIRRDPGCDTAYVQRWVEAAKDRLSAQKNAATRDVNGENERLRDLKGNCDSLKDLAAKSRYLPFVGGGRKKAVGTWAASIVDYLTAVKDEIRYDSENRFYEKMIALLGEQLPSSAEGDSEVISRLERARDTLHALFFTENENLKLLKSKSNQILIGNGNTVVVAGDSDDVVIVDAIDLDFEQFKKRYGIHNPEDFLSASGETKGDLAQFFLNYSFDQLEHLKKITILEAMRCIGKSRGNLDAYITGQFNHLFRLASALWTFDKGRLNLEQRQHYDNIVNFGVNEQLEGRKNYEPYVDKAKVKYQIRADHTYSTTANPHRIWLLNFAAALPAFFLRDLEYNRQKYLNEISPTYHIDKHFEMNVPDLFPIEETANKALRVIGMAIVPGIGVIHDEKLSKGHKFTFDDPGYVEAHNHGQPFEWRLFRDMYDAIVSSYDPQREDNLLDKLVGLLKQKVQSMPADELRKTIEEYCAKVEVKLSSRDFSKLISARLTHYEIKALRTFLEPRGYGMNIDKYIEGELV